ncbi:unnamed protein product [Calicophoron daubneyi]|uniref:Beta-1,4-galactosyltransferase n=1 Tax=Calicophoron daubneyi TaxID=300641 RepID=A0AAV2TYR6_CALDB
MLEKRRIGKLCCLILVLLSIHYLALHAYSGVLKVIGTVTYRWDKLGSSLTSLKTTVLSQEYFDNFYAFVQPPANTIEKSAVLIAIRQLHLSELAENFTDFTKLEEEVQIQLTRENIRVLPGGYLFQIDLHKKDSAKFNIILIPYRKRQKNLCVFLLYIYRYLHLKSANYAIIVLEHLGNGAFNRAKLFNAGLTELGILQPTFYDSNFSGCIIFHDVDKIPENTETPYHCLGAPLQLFRVAVSLDSLHAPKGTYMSDVAEYTYYPGFLGGVTALKRREILRVNGYSNIFTGWGGEDDDFRERMRLRHIRVMENPNNLGRYYVLDHDSDQKCNTNRRAYLGTKDVARRMREDGLRQVQYTLVRHAIRPLYTLYQFML